MKNFNRIVKILVLVFLLFVASQARAQVERVQLVHPVYSFLLHAETVGALKDFSYTILPMQRKDVISSLKEIRANEAMLSPAEKSTLELYEREFRVIDRANRVIFHSASADTSIFWEGFIGDEEKHIYFNADSANSVSLLPLASLEQWVEGDASGRRSATVGQAGLRLLGTIDNTVGYYLQVTNGALIRGEREVLSNDPRLRRNIKFAILNSDFDFAESHVVYEKDWFWASIGRERMEIGSGFYNRAFLNDLAPPADALQLGVRFKNFSYRHVHASLLGSVVSENIAGIGTRIPSKFYVFHRAAFHGSWGEIGLSESIVYSERGYDMAYLVPISFLKSLEHALRDRDNAGMGVDFTVRPWSGFQVKGSWFLDDLIFDEIGKGYWSNKTAWNIGASHRLVDLPVTLTTEYSRVEPYTYTHFEFQNRMTNDDIQFANILPPNSDEITVGATWWFGGRYPLDIRAAYRRHGQNEMEGDSVIRNVGGDVDQTRVFDRGDSFRVSFLDGIRENTFVLSAETGVEIIRGVNLKFLYRYFNTNGTPLHTARLLLRYEDF